MLNEASLIIPQVLADSLEIAVLARHESWPVIGPASEIIDCHWSSSFLYIMGGSI